jgi:hypothetical protein
VNAVEYRSEVQPFADVVRAAPGNTFAIVNLVGPPRDVMNPGEDPYNWGKSVVLDNKGGSFPAKFSTEIQSVSDSQAGFTRKREIHPVTVRIYFEIPNGAAISRITIPESLPLPSSSKRAS